MRRLALWTVLGLLLGVGIAFAIPDSRYRILGFLRHERLYGGRPLGYWLAALKEDDPDQRRRAALTLGDTGICQEPENLECGVIVAGLVEALGDTDGFVRKCAAVSFLALPREAPVPQDAASLARMTGALRDEEVAVRRAAIRALWQAKAAAKDAEGAGDGIARLTEALGDKDDFVRMYAARCLGQIGADAKAAVPTLLEHLRQDEETDVRKLSGKALGLIGAEAIGPLLPQTVQALSAALKEDGAEFREYSARALGQLGDKGAIPALKQATRDKDAHVRAAVAEALKRLEGPTAEKSP